MKIMTVHSFFPLLVLLLCLLGAVTAYARASGTDGALSVCQDYMNALSEGEYDAAYKLLCSQTKRNIEYETYKAYHETMNGLRQISNVSLSNEQIHEDLLLGDTNYSFVVEYDLDYDVKEIAAYTRPTVSNSPQIKVVYEENTYRIFQSITNVAIANKTSLYGQAFRKSEAGQTIDDFIRALDEKMPDNMARYGAVGGSVLLIEDNGQYWIKSYGYADLLGGIPSSRDTVYEAGSISKTVSAWGIMKLAQDGLLSLDDPVEKYLKSWRLPPTDYDSSQITVRRLLEHRGGISIPEDRGYGGYGPGDRLPTLIESLNGTLYPQNKVEVSYEPGTKFQYSSGGYTILTQMVKDLTGLEFKDFIQKNIFSPLKMDASTFDYAKDAHKNMAVGYGYRSKSLPSFRFAEQAGGSFKCTIEDLGKFVIELNRVLSGRGDYEGVLDYSAIEKINTIERTNYILGHFVHVSGVAPRLIEHQGSTKGYKSIYATIPELKSGIIVLHNSDNGMAIMQPLVDEWIRMKVGPARPLFTKHAYTLQTNRDKIEKAAKVVFITLTTVGAILLLYLLFQVMKKRKVFRRFEKDYMSARILGLVLSVCLIALYWLFGHDDLYYKMTPFKDGSPINLYLGTAITLWCTFFILVILFKKKANVPA